MIAHDGAELAVLDVGARDGDTVMLLHGFSLDHSAWEPVMTRLVDAGFRVVAPDLRGHGDSELGSEPPKLEVLHRDLARIATSLGIERYHLVGHSFGAVIALGARVSDSLVDQVMSVTSIAGTEGAIQNPIMRLGARLFSSPLGVRMLQRQQPGRLMISTWFAKNAAVADLDAVRTLSAECPHATRRAIHEATGTLDLRPTFAVAGPPTMVMCGRDDRATPAKFSERIAEVSTDHILS